MQAPREVALVPGALSDISNSLRQQLGDAAPCSPEQLAELARGLLQFSQEALGAQVIAAGPNGMRSPGDDHRTAFQRCAPICCRPPRPPTSTHPEVLALMLALVQVESVAAAASKTPSSALLRCAPRGLPTVHPYDQLSHHDC